MLESGMQKRRLMVVVSLALAVALFALFLSRVNLAEVGRRISALRPADLALAVAASLASLLVRAWRWRVLLEPVGLVTLGESFEATSIGFAASTLLPARAGEVVRPAWLARRTGLPFSSTLSSVVIERLLDLATVLAYFLLYIGWPGWLPAFTAEHRGQFRLLLISAGAAAIALALFVAVAIAALTRRAMAEAFFSRVSRIAPERFRPALARIFNAVLDGMGVLVHRRALSKSIALSLLLWLTVYVQIGFLFRAFALPLPFSATILVLLVTLVGIAIPTPGAVGGFHKAVQIALTFFYGVDRESATGLAIVYHLVAFLPVTAIGLVLFAVRAPSESLARLADAPPEE